MSLEVNRTVSNRIYIKTEGPQGPTGASSDPPLGGDLSGTASAAVIETDTIDTDQLVDAGVVQSKIAAGAINEDKMENFPYQTGDLDLADPTYTSGTVEGGVLRKVTSIQIPWSYTQTDKPTDPGIGTALNVTWDVELRDNTAFVGSNAQTPSFGPRGVINLEGRVNYYNNQSKFGLSPVSFADLQKFSNTPGRSITLTPSWAFMSSSWYIADNATVTMSETDMAPGGASFVDNKIYMTANNGTLDADTGTGTDMIGLVSRPVTFGNVTLKRRRGVVIMDIGRPPSFVSDWGEFLTNYLPDAMAEVYMDLVAPYYTGTVKEQYGVDIEYLDAGTQINAGIRNASAHIETPYTVDITSANTSLPINVAVVNLNPDDDYTLTSTPTIPAGQDGQRLTIINSSGSYYVEGQSEDDLAGTLLADKFILYPGRAVTMMYSDDMGKWVNLNPNDINEEWTVTDGIGFARIVARETGFGHGSSFGLFGAMSDTQPRVAISSVPGVATFGLTAGPGGASTADCALLRTGVGVWSLANFTKITGSTAPTLDSDLTTKLYVDTLDINAQTGTTYTVQESDQGKLVTLTNASAIAVELPQDSDEDIPVGTVITFAQRGAGQVTFAAGTGATVNGTPGLKTRAQYSYVSAVKAAADTWDMMGDLSA